MSIRNVNKDNLKQHASAALVTPDYELMPLPDHQNLLKFWTHHSTENTLVDLTVFAIGDSTSAHRGGKWVGPFTGRPELILQMMPVIQASSLSTSRSTVEFLYTQLRAWWRVLDAVENSVKEFGQPVHRVKDVRQLTRLHQEFAHRSGMNTATFRAFVRIANLTLRSLEAPKLYWNAPESAVPKRSLPPEDQIMAIRIALKQEWEAVRRRWAIIDRFSSAAFITQTDEELILYKHWLYLIQQQNAHGKVLPTSDELRGGIAQREFTTKTGLSLITMRSSIFPDREEADIAFHLCLANTGWNPATLFSLDMSQVFLSTHPKDVTRYVLIGIKAKAGGKEQLVIGLWKTTSGPGYIIRTWMKRTAPLREQLKTTLVAKRKTYAQMTRDGASLEDLTSLHNDIQHLEKGCRSVWLFVGKNGEIEWLNSGNTINYSDGKKSIAYTTKLINRLNLERAKRLEAPISPVSASDFRDIFAQYVWRMSGGSILAVMRALNHAHCSTTERYVDNNIHNAERDNQARTFLDHLISELGAGRLDITILAHLQRHGAVDKEMEQRLSDYRVLQRSRIGVACKDPFNPPNDIQPESTGKRICGPQRCLICKPHAVILPESLSGVSMRVEELEAIEAIIPVETWINSKFPEELRNGLYVLKLFPVEAMQNEREEWKKKIANGSHHIPGIHSVGNAEENA